MSLINLKNILRDAKKNKYAVGSFNVASYDFIYPLIEAATEERSPIILSLSENHFKYLDLEEISPSIINAAKNAKVPVCVNLDHSHSAKTIIRAIKQDFTSVMFDGSEYLLEKNIKLTKEAVIIAHNIEVSVEGEVGYIGGEGIGEKLVVTAAKKELFTTVEDSARFYNETKADALAVSVGNVHGLFRGKPQIDFKRLSDIRDAIPIPLVLHGGSGISDNDLKRAIGLGICKINFFTDMSIAVVEKVRRFLSQNPDCGSYPVLMKEAMEELKVIVKGRMRVFGSSGTL